MIIEELEETVDLTESAVTFELADEDSKQATDVGNTLALYIFSLILVLLYILCYV